MGLDGKSNAIMYAIDDWLESENLLDNKSERGNLSGGISHIYYHSQNTIKLIDDLVEALKSRSEKEVLGNLLIDLETELNSISWEVNEGRNLLDQVLDKVID